MIVVRSATPDDAHEAAALLRRSITELCIPDHKNDKARLSQWLSNKTLEHFLSWLQDPLNTVLVAISEGRMANVGALRDGGAITLNYVHPEARFKGASHAMMDRLEALLREAGQPEAHLVSTLTAQPFYEARGYRVRTLPPERQHPFGLAMEKAL